MQFEAVFADPSDTLGFYIETRTGQFADLEVLAAAAISWSRLVKVAAQSLSPDSVVRISLVAAEPGSSRWLAKIEQSRANQGAKKLVETWTKLPPIVQIALGLAISWPNSGKPAYDFYKEQIIEIANHIGLTGEEIERAKEQAERVRETPAVNSARQKMFHDLQRDPKITGAGFGVAVGSGWRPPLIPSSQFALSEGLFEPTDDQVERVLSLTLDVFLVTPQLENAPRSWRFRQEGLPPFSAVMRDQEFLAALDRDAVKERMRTRIPMTVILEVKQRRINGEWRDVNRAPRSVVKVISPRIDGYKRR